ncbi:MAG TPA: type II toxin-antitoxin system RelE/ParE family toxin [Bryobacteraceae bacterium]|nr:type II toxin-antitoxin system RelE/ParE family toxin [Bryobacteraceae bacterium]
MSGYALHPEAFIDIDEIAAYIGLDSHEAAHRVVDDIYQAIQNAVPFPHSGHRRIDLTNRPLRFIRVRDYSG